VNLKQLLFDTIIRGIVFVGSHSCMAVACNILILYGATNKLVCMSIEKLELRKDI